MGMGAMLDKMMITNNFRNTGELWTEDYILSAAILTKIWVSVFIGVWAFVLVMIWVHENGTNAGASCSWFLLNLVLLSNVRTWLLYCLIHLHCNRYMGNRRMGATKIAAVKLTQQMI